MDSVRIVLVRHGESHWNAAGLIQGHAGVGLTDRGRAQAEAVAAYLFREHPDCRLLVGSDLTRVAETAVPAEKAFGVTARVDRRLREIDVGTWSGKTREQLATDDPDGLDAWQRGLDTPRGGGERLSELQARVLAAVGDIAEEAAAVGQSTAILFTHGGPVRVVVEAVVGVPVDRTRVLGPAANGSVTLVEWELSRNDGGPRGEGDSRREGDARTGADSGANSQTEQGDAAVSGDVAWDDVAWDDAGVARDTRQSGVTGRLLAYNGCGHLPVWPAGASPASSVDVAT